MFTGGMMTPSPEGRPLEVHPLPTRIGAMVGPPGLNENVEQLGGQTSQL